MDRMFEIDKYLSGSSLRDYNKYQLGIYTKNTTVKNTKGESLYTLSMRNQVQYPSIILAENSTSYTVQPDIENVNDSVYTWNVEGVVPKGSIKMINTKKETGTYVDVPTNYWAYKEIKEFAQNGYIDSQNNYFRPADSITRAEFISIVNDIFGYTQKGNETYKDVNTGVWYYDAVCIAVKAGYIDKNNTNFRPNDPISREEVASIISSITKSKDENLNKIKTYKDYQEVSKWARTSVEGVIEKGYMGVGINEFRPKANMTRAEAVVTLYRVAQSNLNKEQTYYDVSSSYWAHKEIEEFAQNGYIDKENKLFYPENDITRAEFIAVINRVFNYRELTKEEFIDVDQSNWYYKDVCIALKAGYISSDESKFRPNDTITREEVSVIISNVKNLKDNNIDTIKKYEDYNQISSWATSSVEAIVENGYMGSGSNTFRPKESITRAESIVTLYRISKNPF